MDICRRYGPALLRQARRILQSEADAQDVVQTLFVDLLRKRRTDVDLPYLYRAVTRRCLNHLRDRKNRARLRDRHDVALRGPVRTTLDGTAVSRDLLEKLMARLDEKRAEVVVYRYFDDMQVQEIAELTGRNRKTIQRWLEAVRQQAQALEVQA